MENPPGILNNTGWISLKMRAVFRFRKSFPFLYLLFRNTSFLCFLIFLLSTCSPTALRSVISIHSCNHLSSSTNCQAFFLLLLRHVHLHPPLKPMPAKAHLQHFHLIIYMDYISTFQLPPAFLNHEEYSLHFPSIWKFFQMSSILYWVHLA